MALRDRLPRYAFLAGLCLNLIASFTVWHFHTASPLAAWWVLLVQVNALVAALVALAGLRWQHRLEDRAVPERDARPLLGLQVALAVAANAAVLLWALGFLLTSPQRVGFAPSFLQAGHLTGWLAWLAAQAAIVGFVERSAPTHRVHILAATGLTAGVLLACFSARWDGGNWLAHHVLTTTWALTGLGVLADGWVGDASTAPPRVSRRWVEVISLFVVLLALRGAWADPARPYGSVTACLSASALLGALTVWSRRPGYVYASGLLVNLAAVLVWQAWVIDHFGVGAWFTWGPGVLDRFVCANVLGLAIGSVLWTAVELTRQRHFPSWDLRGHWLPFAHAAALLSLQLVAILVLGAIASDLTGTGIHLGGALPWMALAAVALALAATLWDEDARFATAALHTLGLLAVGLFLHGLNLRPRDLGWLAALLLAWYLLATSALGSVVPRLERMGQALRLPERVQGWPGPWFPLAQCLLGGAVLALGVWITFDFARPADRFLGPLTGLLLALAGVLLSDAAPSRWRHGLRHATLCLAVLALAETGWSLLAPDDTAVWSHRAVLLLLALVLARAACHFAADRLLPRRSAWVATARELATWLGVLAGLTLLPVFAQELLSFVPAWHRTPMAAWAVVGVAVALLALLADAVHSALTTSRTGYVYLAELLLVLFVVHLRLNAPWLFPRLHARMWPFVAVAIAYAGAGLGEWFRRRGLPVLATPLRHTGVFLPLLPLLAFWARPSDAMVAFAHERLPGLVPFLAYLHRLPHNFSDHAAIWVLVALMCAFVAVSRQSFRYALASALAANFSLWALLVHTEVRFLVHPQLWLIPVALIALVAEHVNRDRLSPYQALAIRYLALLLLYVSSTADLFIAGLGNSVSLPLVLALLSVLGVLAGILLRVRAFLVMGFAFLFLDMFSMIWHAAVDRYQTWVWWASGIVLGAAIIALFAVFEKRRGEVLRLIEDVKQWR
jgi:hypothetical protein